MRKCRDMHQHIAAFPYHQTKQSFAGLLCAYSGQDLCTLYNFIILTALCHMIEAKEDMPLLKLPLSFMLPTQT
jgi:hypothetical protein